MASVTQLGYVGIGAKDVEQWEHYATESLGLQSNGRESDGSLFLRMDEYEYRFAVHPDGKDDISYIGWQVTNERDLMEMEAQLREAGIEVSFGTPEEARPDGSKG